MSVLGGIVGVQLLAIAYGVLRRGLETPASEAASASVVAQVEIPPVAEAAAPDTATVEETPPPAVAEAVTTPSAPMAQGPNLELESQVIEDPGAPPFVGPASASAGGQGLPPLFTALEAAARSRPLPDGILERLLVAGVEHRGKGNTQGALGNFREVESALPEDPRVLSEIAATLGKMGLKERATGYWERVEALGELGAGAYFPIASRELHGGAELTEAAQPPAVGEGPKPIRIGEVKVEQQAPTEEGQKVSLSVVIDADPALPPVADDLSLIVNFYDRLPSGEIRPSTAETSYLYPTEPYDWQIDGTETIVVNYRQPAFTEEERLDVGERSFYGYVAELYYRDELQGKVTMPEDIATLRIEPEPAAPDAGNPRPENRLFPTPVPVP